MKPEPKHDKYVHRSYMPLQTTEPEVQIQTNSGASYTLRRSFAVNLAEAGFIRFDKARNTFIDPKGRYSPYPKGRSI